MSAWSYIIQLFGCGSVSALVASFCGCMRRYSFINPLKCCPRFMLGAKMK